MSGAAARLFIEIGANVSGAMAGMKATDAQLKKTAATAEASNARIVRSQKRSGASMVGYGKTASKAALGVGGAAAAVGIGVAVAAKSAANFEAQMSTLQAVSRASGRQMTQFEKQAMSAGAATKFSALEAAQAQTELAKGGMSVRDIMGGGLKAALGLAAAGDLELADAATYTSNAMNMFGIKGKNATRIADQLATASLATTSEVQDFGMALTQGGSAAKTAGLSLRGTMVYLEALAKIGVKNSDAGTSMKAAMIQLLSPSEKQAALAKKLGLTFADNNGHMKSATQLSGDLRRATDGMTKAERLHVFSTLAGTDGQRVLSALWARGPGQLRNYAQGLKASGSAAEMARKRQDNLKGAVENLGGSLETLAIKTGSPLMTPLKVGVQQVTAELNKLGQKGGTKNAIQSALGLSPTEQSEIGEGFSAAFGRVSDGLKGAMPGIKQAIGGQMRAFGGAFKVAGAALRGDVKGVFSGLGDIAKGNLEKNVGRLKSAAGGAKSILTGMQSKGASLGGVKTAKISYKVKGDSEALAKAKAVRKGLFAIPSIRNIAIKVKSDADVVAKRTRTALTRNGRPIEIKTKITRDGNASTVVAPKPMRITANNDDVRQKTEQAKQFVEGVNGLTAKPKIRTSSNAKSVANQSLEAIASVDGKTATATVNVNYKTNGKPKGLAHGGRVSTAMSEVNERGPESITGPGGQTAMLGDGRRQIMPLPIGWHVNTASDTKRMGIGSYAKGGKVSAKTRKRRAKLRDRADKFGQSKLDTLDFQESTGSISTAKSIATLESLLKSAKFKKASKATKRSAKSKLYDLKTTQASSVKDLEDQAAAVGLDPAAAAQIAQKTANRHLAEARKTKNAERIAQAQLEVAEANNELLEAQKAAAEAQAEAVKAQAEAITELTKAITTQNNMAESNRGITKNTLRSALADLTNDDLGGIFGQRFQTGSRRTSAYVSR
jgi:TP901 family phage tail tape measure protein